MLRLIRIARPQLTGIRSYSGGFEISSYLSRIEAITKRGPISHKPKRRTAPSANAAAAPKDSAQNAKRRAKPDGARASGNNTVTSSSPSGERSKKPRSAPRSTNTRRNESKEKSPESAVQTRSSTANSDASNAEWASIDTFSASTSSRPLPRSSRRVTAKKSGSKAKTAKKQRTKETSQRNNKGQSALTLREHVPFLTPKEGLSLVLRNEGTSAGGYIEPVDVSLASLQPNLVSSAVTYNSRVRSLLNSIPPSVSHDSEELKKMVNSYISGKYDRSLLEANQGSLSYRALASEVFANPTMNGETKQFFAQVGAGKLTPRQIVSRT